MKPECAHILYNEKVDETSGADPPSVPKAPGQSRIFTSIFVP